MSARRATRLGAIATLMACTSVETTPVTVAPGMVASVTSPSVEIASGGVELIVAVATRVGDFDGDISFVVDDAPEGLRTETSATVTADGVSSALLAIAAGSVLPQGTYPLTVRAIGFGIPDAKVGLSITVVPAGTPSYTLEARPLTATPGGSVTGNASIDRGANTKGTPVTLTAQNLPAGVTATLYPATNTSAIATLTVGVGREVAPGHYSVTIRGVAAGLSDRIAVIPLTVVAGP